MMPDSGPSFRFKLMPDSGTHPISDHHPRPRLRQRRLGSGSGASGSGAPSAPPGHPSPRRLRDSDGGGLRRAPATRKGKAYDSEGLRLGRPTTRKGPARRGSASRRSGAFSGTPAGPSAAAAEVGRGLARPSPAVRVGPSESGLPAASAPVRDPTRSDHESGRPLRAALGQPAGCWGGIELQRRIAVQQRLHHWQARCCASRAAAASRPTRTHDARYTKGWARRRDQPSHGVSTRAAAAGPVSALDKARGARRAQPSGPW